MIVRLHCALLAVAILPGTLLADPWKDESGHGRRGPPHWSQRGGEPPDWARGRGAWDGHYKHGGHPEYRQQWIEPPAYPYHGGVPHYAPGVPYDWDRLDRWDRWEDAREREREKYHKWQEKARKREEKIREKQRKEFEKWRERKRDRRWDW